MPESVRTRAEIDQEYTNIAAQLGQLTYQKELIIAQTSKLMARMQQLSMEPARLEVPDPPKPPEPQPEPEEST